MPDLIDKFFQEDLTDAERTILGEQLSTSDEAARKFGEKAEEAYQAFGLPEPHWNGPDELNRHHPSGSMTWVWLGLLTVLLFGVLVWRFMISLKSEETPLTTPQENTSLSTTPEIANSPSAQKKKSIHTSNRALPANQANGPNTLPPTQVITTAPASLPPYLPRFTPVNVDRNPNHAFSTLSISLRLVTPRTVSVQVLNADGVAILPLFNGTLPAGDWAFEWNGLLKDGRLAPPGRYRILVQSGSWSQAKDVLIQK
jgi:hypothetical protein